MRASALLLKLYRAMSSRSGWQTGSVVALSYKSIAYAAHRRPPACLIAHPEC